MPDEQVAVQKEAETATVQTDSPQVETPITGEQTTQQETVQTPVAEDSDVSTGMSEEQRRAFQEMRLENKRLKEEKEVRPQEPSAFDAFKPQVTTYQTGPIQIGNYQDPITGETNWQDYNQAQQRREQQILQQARTEAQNTVQETLDEERARRDYPELMSNPVTEKQIASRWLYEKFQGNNVSITNIASEFARNFKQAVSKAEKIGEERALNEVSEKEQASTTVPASSAQARVATSFEDQQQLGEQTRRGNQDAITARISKIPWANK